MELRILFDRVKILGPSPMLFREILSAQIDAILEPLCVQIADGAVQILGTARCARTNRNAGNFRRIDRARRTRVGKGLSLATGKGHKGTDGRCRTLLIRWHNVLLLEMLVSLWLYFAATEPVATSSVVLSGARLTLRPPSFETLRLTAKHE